MLSRGEKALRQTAPLTKVQSSSHLVRRRYTHNAGSQETLGKCASASRIFSSGSLLLNRVKEPCACLPNAFPPLSSYLVPTPRCVKETHQIANVGGLQGGP